MTERCVETGDPVTLLAESSEGLLLFVLEQYEEDGLVEPHKCSLLCCLMLDISGSKLLIARFRRTQRSTAPKRSLQLELV